MININELQYFPVNYQLKLQGVLVEGQDGEPILSEYFGGFNTYLQKIICEDEQYTYYVLFEIGYVLLYYFYKGEKSMYDIFMLNKNYCIVRIKHDLSTIEHSTLLLKENKESFALEYGPLKNTYYNTSTYTEYANNQANKLVK